MWDGLKGDFWKDRSYWEHEKKNFCVCKACIWEKMGWKGTLLSPSPPIPGHLLCSLASFPSFWWILSYLFKCCLRARKERAEKGFWATFPLILSPLLRPHPSPFSAPSPAPTPTSDLNAIWGAQSRCPSGSVTMTAWQWALPGLPITVSGGFF